MVIKSMLIPVRFYTSVCYYVGPNEERTPMWQGQARVCGALVAEIFESARIRTEKALLYRLTEQVRGIHRRHLNQEVT